MKSIAALLTPRLILVSYCAALVLFELAQKPAGGELRDWLLVARGVLAYGAAMVLCLVAAGEHKPDSWFRVAWVAFTVNAGASIFRHAVDTELWDRVWPGYSEGIWISLLRQSAIVLGLGALLVGLIAIVWAFDRMGIGISPGKWELTAIAGVFAALVGIFYFREGLAEFHRDSELARVLQQVGVTLLAASAAVSILVYRIAREMRGGRLGLTMLWIVIYTVARCVLLLASLLPLPDFQLRPFMGPFELSVPWLFALAAAYRCGLASHGAAHIPESSPVSQYVKQTFPRSARIS